MPSHLFYSQDVVNTFGNLDKLPNLDFLINYTLFTNSCITLIFLSLIFSPIISFFAFAGGYLSLPFFHQQIAFPHILFNGTFGRLGSVLSSLI